MDTRTKKLIHNAMDELMKNRTSFVIAHRLSTIKNANTIIVIDRGIVIKELLNKKGYYYNTLNR
ncbi:hypothetical protein [uncultured Methanobrevibacter sp.]|uniref:hypothetical protein n=1 Tax=uncultured Methanobrevibacter sp. TaxID=253161 RepID=UPI0025F83FF9|nr:hypothetical protein [uncultured Methanobrevibacter sp.]